MGHDKEFELDHNNPWHVEHSSLQQRSPEWFKSRRGNIGCSRLADVLASGKGGTESLTRKSYMQELLCERLTGERKESYTSKEMQYGIDMEPTARATYEIERGVEVETFYGQMHPTIDRWWGSPDGLVGLDGMIEIKCPATTTHIDTIMNGTVNSRYIYQMAGYLEIFGRDWIDFVSYDGRVPDELQIYIRRFTRAELPLDKCREGVIGFLEELNAMEKTLRERMA